MKGHFWPSHMCFFCSNTYFTPVTSAKAMQFLKSVCLLLVLGPVGVIGESREPDRESVQKPECPSEFKLNEKQVWNRYSRIDGTVHYLPKCCFFSLAIWHRSCAKLKVNWWNKVFRFFLGVKTLGNSWQVYWTKVVGILTCLGGGKSIDMFVGRTTHTQVADQSCDLRSWVAITQ